MKKVRVLHIITNLALGGAQKNALYIIANLDGKKYEKYFVSAPWGGLYDDIGQYNEISFHFFKCLKRGISPIQDIRAFFALARFMLRNKVSIVHTHSSKAGILGRWAAKFAKIPIIIHSVHGWSFHEYLHKPVKAVYIFLERLTARITTRFIAVSDSDIKKGLDNKIGTAKQYELIRYGIETNKFYKVGKQQNRQKKLTVGMIACLKAQKNPLDFIKAAAVIAKQNKEVDFVCIGDGPLRHKMENEIKRNELGPRVKLLGWRKDIPDLISMMDIVVLSSLWEGLPIALLEAMASAKPIVAYNADGIREAVKQGENGYLVTPGDAAGLAKRIQELLDNRQLAESMGQKGRKRFEKAAFSAAYMMKAIENLYEGLLSKQGGKKGYEFR